MSFESDIFDLLGSVPAIATNVGPRMFWDIIPQSVALPNIRVVTLFTNMANVLNDNVPGIEQPRIQIDFYAANDQKTVNRSMRNGFVQKLKDYIPTGSIKAIRVTNIRDTVEVADDGGDPGKQRTIIELDISSRDFVDA